VIGWLWDYVAGKVLDRLVDSDGEVHKHDMHIENMHIHQPWDDDRFTDAEKALLRKRARQ
jgi:hypothetical protein